MIQLNLADDYFREKERADQLEERVERLEKEAYDLKHKLVSNQIKNDKA
jgi:cell division protein ZapA